MDRRFLKAQWKFIFSSMVAYAFFYVTRKNLSMAQPYMLEEGVITKYALGLIMTTHGVLYGVSRFANGFWADRLNGRIFMAIGLAFCAVFNFLFGCSSVTILFGVFWVANGWVQGMGFPAATKMLTHWIHPSELATKMSVWNASHSIGAAIALGLCSGLVVLGYTWRECFYVPAVLTGLVAVFTFFCVKDGPEEEGLPPLELGINDATGGKSAGEGGAQLMTMAERRRLVYGNKVIWFVAFANFFVYVLRFGFLDWGPTFLKEFKGVPVSKGGLMIIAFELAAVVGTIFAGWLTDRVFKGRGVRTCVFCMLGAALFSFGFWYLPNGAPTWAATLLLMAVGFCIYGPQALVCIIAANQATKEAAAMANGFTGIMGYAATTVSGFGIAVICERLGWGATLVALVGFALVGMVLFLCAWNSSANGYNAKDANVRV